MQKSFAFRSVSWGAQTGMRGNKGSRPATHSEAGNNCSSSQLMPRPILKHMPVEASAGKNRPLSATVPEATAMAAQAHIPQEEQLVEAIGASPEKGSSRKQKRKDTKSRGNDAVDTAAFFSPTTSSSKAAMASQAAKGSQPIFNPEGANADIIRSGHLELNSLYASNDIRTGPITVNLCNAPNNSTVQCGCENISCPFCNLMLSIEQTDPTVLQWAMLNLGFYYKEKDI